MTVLGACLGLVLTACGGDTSGGPDRSEDGPTAAPAATSSTLVAAAGDIACPPGQAASGNKCRQAATARLAVSVKRPSYVLALGDTQYEQGTYWQHMHSYDKSWGLLRGKTFPVVGNHEYRTPGAGGYFRYFAGRTPPNPGYYSRVINGWRVYLLNSNCAYVDCSRQRAWLGASMKHYPSRCSMIVLHHPRYSSGAHGNQGVAKGFWSVALAHRTDIALAGHDHDYERFVRMDNSSRWSRTGMVSYVVGTGGKNLYPKRSTKPGSRFFYNGRHGLLYLALNPTGWTYEFRTIDNVVKDRGSGTCI